MSCRPRLTSWSGRIHHRAAQRAVARRGRGGRVQRPRARRARRWRRGGHARRRRAAHGPLSLRRPGDLDVDRLDRLRVLAGGPAVSPALDAVVVAALAPMAGISRPMVTASDEPIRLTLQEGGGCPAIEVDGTLLAAPRPARRSTSGSRSAAGRWCDSTETPPASQPGQAQSARPPVPSRRATGARPSGLRPARHGRSSDDGGYCAAPARSAFGAKNGVERSARRARAARRRFAHRALPRGRPPAARPTGRPRTRSLPARPLGGRRGGRSDRVLLSTGITSSSRLRSSTGGTSRRRCPGSCAARDAAGQHRRRGRLDADQLDAKIALLQDRAGAGDRAAGADARDEVVDLPVEVLPDLGAGGAPWASGLAGFENWSGSHVSPSRASACAAATAAFMPPIDSVTWTWAPYRRSSPSRSRLMPCGSVSTRS